MTLAEVTQGKEADEISTVYVVVEPGVATGFGIVGSDNPVIGDHE